MLKNLTVSCSSVCTALSLSVCIFPGCSSVCKYWAVIGMGNADWGEKEPIRWFWSGSSEVRGHSVARCPELALLAAHLSI